jgi:hypothetical protein
MCRPLAESIQQGRKCKDGKTAQRWSQLEADIGHFIEGGYITEDRLKQLEPHKFEHWTLRSLKPRPSFRVFGRFAKPDVFVGTHLVERKSLGAKWSTCWEHEKLVCEEHWQRVGLRDPYSGEKYQDYITENSSRANKVRK